MLVLGGALLPSGGKR